MEGTGTSRESAAHLLDLLRLRLAEGLALAVKYICLKLVVFQAVV